MATADKVVQGLVAAALGDWRAKLRTTAKGNLLETWQNVYTYLDNHPDWKGVLGLDTFALRVVKRRVPPFASGAQLGPWTDNDDLELGLWLSQRDEDRFVVKSMQPLVSGVAACAMRHSFHPVREFLLGCKLPQKRRMDTWLTDFLGVPDTPYARAVGRYFLINLVARIMEPGCIMRSVMVLEGGQERGKSTALYTLAQPWFADSHFDLQSKDAFEVIQGVWLYEISEMESFNKREATDVKQFISSREDNYRPAYERRAQRVPRQVVFSGSTNESSYLKDWTGNTRFWPVETGEIRIDELAAAREGLLAEAVEAWQNKARRHPTREEALELFEPEQAMRMPEPVWTPLVEDFLNKPAHAGAPLDKVSVMQVLSDGLGIKADRMTATHQRDVGIILSRVLGWKQVRPWGKGNRPRFYVRPGAATQGGEQTHQSGAQREPGSDDEPLPL